MSNSKIPCPFCHESIDAMNMSYQCPACGFIDNQWNIMKNCDFCRYSPRFIVCPHCQADFDFMLLLGDFHGESDTVLNPETKKSFDDNFSFRMMDLKVQIHTKEFDVDYYAANVTEDDSDKVMALQFKFPYELERAVLYTFFMSPDKRRWFHFWVYKKIGDENPIGQVTLVLNFNSAQGEEAACAAREIYY